MLSSRVSGADRYRSPPSRRLSKLVRSPWHRGHVHRGRVLRPVHGFFFQSYVTSILADKADEQTVLADDCLTVGPYSAMRTGMRSCARCSHANASLRTSQSTHEYLSKADCDF